MLGRQDYQWRHEPIIYGWREGAGHYFIVDRSQDTVIEEPELNLDGMTKQELADLVRGIFAQYGEHTSVIECPRPARSDEHPTMKPVALIGRLISNSSKPGWVVGDFFAGSGTTLIAAEQLQRTARVMELDTHYCDVIIDRWESMTGEKAVLADGL